MNNNKFIEYVAVDRNQYQDMLAELRKEPIVVVEPEKQKPLTTTSLLMELIDSLPVTSRNPARQLLKQLLKGREFGFDTANGEILRFLPEKGYRYRVPGSNLYDILNALCKQTPPPHHQQQQAHEIPIGMKTMLDMLVLTPLGSAQIVNIKYRELFEKFRKNKIST